MKLNYQYTYGELTRGILQEEPKKGNSKVKQMKHIESLYKVEQLGRKYILVEKYDTPKEIVDNRGGNNDKCQKYLIPLIKNLAVCSSSYSIIIPMTDVQDVFNFVSEIAMGKHTTDYKKLAEDIGCHRVVVKDILQSNYDNFTSVIRGAIEKIGDDAYWNARELIEVTRADGTKELLYGGYTNKEESDLLATEEKEIEARGLKKKHAKFTLIVRNQYLDFLNNVCSSLRKQGYDIKSYRKVLYCVAPQSHIAELNNFKLTKEQEEECLTKIREYAFNSALGSATYRHDKALKVEDIGSHKTARVSKKVHTKEEISKAREKMSNLGHKVQKTETIDSEIVLGYVDESKKAIDKIIGKGLNGAYSDTKGNREIIIEQEPDKEIQDKLWEEYLEYLKMGI